MTKLTEWGQLAAIDLLTASFAMLTENNRYVHLRFPSDSDTTSVDTNLQYFKLELGIEHVCRLNAVLAVAIGVVVDTTRQIAIHGPALFVVSFDNHWRRRRGPVDYISRGSYRDIPIPAKSQTSTRAVDTTVGHE